jgi:hypothetical protein
MDIPMGSQTSLPDMPSTTAMEMDYPTGSNTIQQSKSIPGDPFNCSL